MARFSKKIQQMDLQNLLHQARRAEENNCVDELYLCGLELCHRVKTQIVDDKAEQLALSVAALHCANVLQKADACLQAHAIAQNLSFMLPDGSQIKQDVENLSEQALEKYLGDYKVVAAARTLEQQNKVNELFYTGSRFLLKTNREDYLLSPDYVLAERWKEFIKIVAETDPVQADLCACDVIRGRPRPMGKMTRYSPAFFRNMFSGTVVSWFYRNNKAELFDCAIQRIMAPVRSESPKTVVGRYLGAEGAAYRNLDQK